VLDQQVEYNKRGSNESFCRPSSSANSSGNFSVASFESGGGGDGFLPTPSFARLQGDHSGLSGSGVYSMPSA